MRTPFFGREKEREEIRRVFGAPKPALLTIVGLGGMGKTRLAREVIGELPSLLWLDVEERADAAVYARLAGAERALVSAREPLDLPGEAVLFLGPLDEASARALFYEHAVPKDRSPLADKIVARLEGIPLAIELCARRTESVSLAVIDALLENRFELLRAPPSFAPNRHGSWLEVLKSSWIALEPEQKAAFAALAGASSFDFEDARALLPRAQVLDLLHALHRKSFLLREGDRYRVLESLRDLVKERERAWRIARNGRRVASPDGRVYDFSRRDVLARLCAILARTREHPERDFDLIRALWPEEPRLHHSSGKQRLKTAIWALRDLGLKELIVRREDRYCIDPQIAVVIED